MDSSEKRNYGQSADFSLGLSSDLEFSETIELSKKLRRASNAAKASRFIAVVRQRDDLSGLLEAMFIALLLKKRHPDRYTSILVHPDNHKLALASQLFDDVFAYNHESSLRQYVKSQKARLLYIPYQDLRAQLLTTLAKSKVRTLGFGKSILSRFLDLHHLGRVKGLSQLSKYGYNLKPEASLPHIDEKLDSSHLQLPTRNFIWLSLFKEDDFNRQWPAAYAARLARLLEDNLNLDIVVPLYSEKAYKKIADPKKYAAQLAFLQKNTTNLHLIKNLSPQDRAIGMQQALAVVGTAGADMMLASVLRRPQVTIHDMRSYHAYSNGKSKQAISKAKQGVPEFYYSQIQKQEHDGYDRRILFWQSLLKTSQRELMHYMHSPHLQQRHIVPAVDECIEHCFACRYDSCVEYISPEQIFEGLKKLTSFELSSSA